MHELEQLYISETIDKTYAANTNTFNFPKRECNKLILVYDLTILSSIRPSIALRDELNTMFVGYEKNDDFLDMVITSEFIKTCLNFSDYLSAVIHFDKFVDNLLDVLSEYKYNIYIPDDNQLFLFKMYFKDFSYRLFEILDEQMDRELMRDVDEFELTELDVVFQEYKAKIYLVLTKYLKEE